MIDIAELRRLEEEATPGPWDNCGNCIEADTGTVSVLVDTSDADAALIVAMRNALPELLKAVEWQPIETAPKDMTEIIVLCGQKDIRLGWYFAPSTRTFGWFDQRQNKINPTHWMPLPLPPHGGGDVGE